MKVWLSMYGTANDGVEEIRVCGSIEIANRELSKMKEQEENTQTYGAKWFEIEKRELIEK
jgi:hypothetical protein